MDEGAPSKKKAPPKTAAPSTPPPRDKDEEIAELKKKLLAATTERNEVAAERDKIATERDELATERDRIATERDELARKQAKTKFLDYLSLIDLHVFGQFSVETNRDWLATGTTSVAGKFCPRRLLFWSDFETLHNQKFDALEDALNDQDASFESPNAVAAYDASFSPYARNEQNLRPFIRIAIERPAAAIVNKYLSVMYEAKEESDNETRECKIVFQDDEKIVTHTNFAADIDTSSTSNSRKRKQADKGWTPRKATNSKSASSSKRQGIPDRCGMCIMSSVMNVAVRFLLGEYKAAHRLPPQKLKHILANPPVDFLLKASKTDKDVDGDGRADDVFFSGKYPSVYLAKALCQAYDYMVSSALQYGYVATGDGLVLLHVSADDIDTLHFYCVTFESGQSPRPQPNPRTTAAAYLSTLSVVALRYKEPSQAEIAQWAQGRHRWPAEKRQTLPVRPSAAHDDDDDNDDNDDDDDDNDDDDDEENSDRAGEASGDNDGQQGRKKQTRHKPSSTGSSAGRKEGGATTKKTGEGSVERHRLPFCTQACLLGLCRNLPLDPNCPNMKLHRAAALRDQKDPDRHPLDLAQMHQQLLRQSEAAITDFQRYRLEPCGLSGRYGHLYRVTVEDGYGYSLVAKATYDHLVEDLEHELEVYDELRDCQGTLIPVCLGHLTVSSRFTGHYHPITELLLLSYAGRDLSKPWRLPWGICYQEAMDRTTSELAEHGLVNLDVRVHNCAWNEEMQRVMQFDFDQAHVDLELGIDEVKAIIEKAKNQVEKERKQNRIVKKKPVKKKPVVEAEKEVETPKVKTGRPTPIDVDASKPAESTESPKTTPRSPLAKRNFNSLHVENHGAEAITSPTKRPRASVNEYNEG